VDAAWPATLSAGQIVASSTATGLSDLKNDTQDIIMDVIDIANNLVNVRGFSENYPEAGTLYEKKKSLQTKLTQISNDLHDCLNPIERR